MNSPTILFPAFIKFAGSDELEYIADQADLAYQLAHVILAPTDRLIDSLGQQFTFAESDLVFQQTQAYEAVLGLLQQHAVALGKCCVAKMGASSIKGLIELVDQLSD